MKPSNLEIKLDLMAIIDAAFYEFDDYVTDCHDRGDSPCLDVEVFVAEAIMRAGYRKVETDINDGGKTKDGDICRQNTPTNTPTCTNLHQLTPIEEMSAEIQEAVNGCSSYWSGLIAEHLHEQGYRKQSEGEWEPRTDVVGFVRCSVCKDCNVYDEWADGKKWHFCPNCGAKMKGGERE